MNAIRVAVLCFCYGCSGGASTTSADPAKSEEPNPAPIDGHTDIKTLIERINDIDPSGRHFGFTPAVDELIARGPSVIPNVLPLMESDDWATRYRAQRVLEGASTQLHGFRLGKGWVDLDGEKRWRQWWKDLGDLHADMDKQDRIRAIKLWKGWLARHQG